MNKNFRYKLTGILISFTLLLSLIIIVADYVKLKESVKVNLETQIQMAENAIITSLSTIDKVYNVFELERVEQMELYSQELVEQYRTNPDFSTWDYNTMKNESGMDVFILNADNQIIESSYLADIGLDFNACCSDFAILLNKRRESGVFSHDPFDLQQATGEFKKFSYMPTPDKKYIIELAYSLEDKLVFKEFNFLDTMHRLAEENDQIKEVKVYNSIGFLLGNQDTSEEKKIHSSRLDIFREVFSTFESKELTIEENGQMLTYRYIPYKADDSVGISTHRVVEIAYYDIPVTSGLKAHRKQFILQIIAIIFVTTILSILLAKIISRPIYLAFHDVLTGLNNRAAFEDAATDWLRKKNGSLRLMIVDLDNFKMVNDSLGHIEGDKLLVQAAKIIDVETGESHLAARIGGDEFVILFSDLTEIQVIEIADNLMRKIRETFSYLQHHEINLSISIGIAKAEKNDTINSLFQKADIALYKSKNKGRDQYTIYDGNE